MQILFFLSFGHLTTEQITLCQQRTWIEWTFSNFRWRFHRKIYQLMCVIYNEYTHTHALTSY